MKKIILIFILLLIVPNQVFAEDTEENEKIMKSTKEEFNIKGFIDEAEKYTGDFFEDMDLTDMFNQAIQGKIDNQKLYKKIINLLGKEVTSSLKTLISILVIIVIHGQI